MFRDHACSPYRNILVASAIGVGVFLFPNGVQSATSNSATLQWAANQESDLAGYRVYHGTAPGIYGNSQTVGKTNTYQYANLESNKTHYFSVTAYDMSGNESPPSLEISKAVTTPGSYVVVDPSPGLQVGGLVYIDRTYTFTTVPSSVQGVGYIQTANNEKNATAFPFLSFTVHHPVIVYVAYDVRLTPPPWFNTLGFTDTGENLVTSDTTLNLFARSYTAGLVELGGNQARGNGSMYSVIVKPEGPPPSHSLSVSLTGDGGGTVSSSPTGVSCSSGTCSGTFPQGSSVTLTAAPKSGSTFSGWGGACTGTGTCVAALSTSSASVSANFVASPPPPSALSVTVTGTGNGSVIGGVSCSSGTCSGTFSQGSSVTLTAAPSNGSTFAGWGGMCAGTGSCVVALSTSSASVSANFVASPPPSSALSVTLAGSGSGIVTGGVPCSSGTCSRTFAQGSSVTLIAAPSSGSTFSGWGGMCIGTGSCVVALSTSSASVSANFVLNPMVSRSLNVSLTGDGNGSVRSSPSGLTCSGGTCSGSFPQGTKIILTPTTLSGSIFQGWNGICSGTSNCDVTLSSSQVVTAAFVSENSEPSLPKPNLPILVNFQPTASQVPTNFKKDDGNVFTNTRGYGWNKLLNGMEKNSTADKTLDTFVSASNQSPSTWNFRIPNGIYYVTMVLGDPKDAQGPHWVSVEGFQLAKQVNTTGGEYLAIVDYSVEVKDLTLSLTLGNSGQGQTTLNYLAINEKPNLSNTSQTLAQSFGTPLITSILNPGEATKVNPVVLVQKAHEEKDLQEKAIAQEKKLQEKNALALANEKKQKEQEAVALKQAQAKQEAVALKQAQAKQQAVALKQAQAKQQAVALKQAQAKQQAVVLKQAQAKQQAVALRQAQAKQQKEKEVVKLNKIKDKMSSIRKSGGAVTLRNLFGRP